MKTLTLLLLFLVSFKSYGQDSAKMVFGIYNTHAPMVSKMSDGTWEVSGDSMTAIIMLWREIERRDSVSNVRAMRQEREYNKLANKYNKLVDVILAEGKRNKQALTDLQNNIKNLKQ